MKVTAEQIRAALKMSGGNVARTAIVLGLARNNLYKRLAHLGIDPMDYRGNTAPVAPATRRAPTAPTRAENKPTARTEATDDAPLSGTVILTVPPSGATLARVTNTAAAAVEEEAERPKRLRVSRTFYLRPDQVKAIEDACLDLPAVLREQMSPSKVVERYLDWGYERFLAEMKGETAAASERRKKK